jgi:hypothetical protein
VTTAFLLDALGASLRRWRRAAWGAAALAALALCLALFSWLARGGVLTHPAWVLAAWLAALAVVAVVLGLASRDRRYSSRWLAADFERRAAWRRGVLTGLLEPSVAGTSPELLAAADEAAAADLRAKAPPLLAPLLEGIRRRAFAAAALFLAGVLTLLGAGPSHGDAAALWHPGRAWRATVAPVRIEASRTEVMRGESVTLTLDAFGRRSGTLWIRAPGETWRAEAVAFDSTGRAERLMGPLDGDLFVRLSSGGRGSDTLHIQVRMPAFLGALTLTAHYPRYLRLEDEPLPTDGDTLVIPAGTRLDVAGSATARLRDAAWESAGRRWALDAEGEHFRGRLEPRQSATFRLALATRDGAPLVGDPVVVPVRVVPDRAPIVDLPVPGTDTVIPPSLAMVLVIDARDDHGLGRVLVESRRVSRLGLADSAVVETVPLRADALDRVILTWNLDLKDRGLLPGDTVRVRAIAFDNAPAPGVGRSQEYLLRMAALDELREAARQASQALGSQLDSLSRSARKLERQTEDLARERAQGGSRQGQTEQSALAFEAAKRGEAVAAEQERLQRQAEAVRKNLVALEQAAREAGLNDPAWMARLEEVRRQLDQALTPELRDKLAALQQALKSLDPEQAKQALADLAQAQQQLREALERSKELFRRAAQEGELANLSAEAKDLAQQQQSWNQQAATADSSRAAAQEQQLATRADSLASALSQMASQMDSVSRQNQMTQAGQQAQRAASQMKSAAQAAQRGQRQSARKSGEQALQEMQPLGDQLQQQRQEMQQEWREEVTRALDASMADASRLSERQLALADRMRRGESGADVRGEQGALQEGVARLGEQVREAQGKNALVSPQASGSLSAAERAMSQAREAISNPAPDTRTAAEQAGEAVDALNAASMQLARSRGDVSGSGSGSGLAEALEKMNQLASQQGQVGQQSGGMLPMMGGGGAAVQEQLRQLAAQQASISQALERMRASGEIPGAGAMADEAQDLARQLEAGKLDRQTVERQERLFRHMLDAGRTLQGEQQDEQKERRSTAAKDDSVHLPPALRARLQDDSGVIRLPGWETLQQLAPEERRLVLEYFRRLTERGPR